MAYPVYSNIRSIKEHKQTLNLRLHGKKYKASDGTIRSGKRLRLYKDYNVLEVIVKQGKIIKNLSFTVNKSDVIETVLDVDKLGLELGYFEIEISIKKRCSSGGKIVNKVRMYNYVVTKQFQKKISGKK